MKLSLLLKAANSGTQSALEFSWFDAGTPFDPSRMSYEPTHGHFVGDDSNSRIAGTIWPGLHGLQHEEGRDPSNAGRTKVYALATVAVRAAASNGPGDHASDASPRDNAAKEG